MTPAATNERRFRGPQTAIGLLAIAVLLHVAIGLNAWRTVARHSGDFDRFHQIASEAGQAYRDYAVEYPPATIAIFELAGRVTAGRDGFRALLILISVVADLAVVGALAWAWGIRSALCYGVVVVPILSLLFFRMDLWSVALTTIGVAAWERRRPGAAAVALAAGTALKLWPLPFAVLLMARRRDREAWAIGLFGLFGVVTLVHWWLAGGGAGLSQVLTFRAARGWHIETIVGSLLRLADPSTVRLESGALRIGSIDTAASVVMLAAGACLAAAGLWAGARRDAIGVGWLAGIVGLLLLSPLLSPQFLGWIAPAAGVAYVQGHRRSAGLAFAAVLMTDLYRIRMWPIGVVARDAVLVAVAWSAVIDLNRQLDRALPASDRISGKDPINDPNDPLTESMIR